MDAAIYKANEKMTFLANDKEVLRLYHMREMAQIDYNSGMKKAKEEGRKEGREEGRKEGREEGREEGAEERNIEIARNMKIDGEPVEKIVKYTGLTKESIENLEV